MTKCNIELHSVGANRIVQEILPGYLTYRKTGKKQYRKHYLDEDTDHCYSVIEERFAEYIDEEEVVDVDFLEDGDDRDGIDSRDERREDEHFEEREVHGEEMEAVHPEEGQAWKPIQINEVSLLGPPCQKKN